MKKLRLRRPKPHSSGAESSRSITIATAKISAIAAISSSLITGVAAVIAPGNIWNDIKPFTPWAQAAATCPVRQKEVRLELKDKILKRGESTLVSVIVANDQGLPFLADWQSNLNGTFELLDDMGKTARYIPPAASSQNGKTQIDRITVTVQDQPDQKCTFNLSTAIAIAKSTSPVHGAANTPTLPLIATRPR